MTARGRPGEIRGLCAGAGTVFAASDGYQCPAGAPQRTHAVLRDLHLPVMDGRGVAIAASRSVLACACRGTMTPSSNGVATAFGDYLAKRITPDIFGRQIETLSSANDLGYGTMSRYLVVHERPENRPLIVTLLWLTAPGRAGSLQSRPIQKIPAPAQSPFVKDPT